MGGSSQDGYATPAAAAISMAIAVVTIGYVSRATMELRLARADFKKTQAEYLLSGAHDVALLAIVTGARPPPYRFTVPSLGRAFKVIAEPEWPKLRLDAALDLDDDVMDRLGVTDHEGLRARLSQLPKTEGLPWAADASAAKAWRTCAGAIISPYGESAAAPKLGYVDPDAGRSDAQWRAGQVWRVVVTDEDGWRDERIVRFTGNGLNPAVVISRRLSRGWKEDFACETLLVAG